MPRERISVAVPVEMWDENGDQTSAQLVLRADDEDAARPDRVDCRLIGSGADGWILNVDRETLLRALEVLGQERSDVPNG